MDTVSRTQVLVLVEKPEKNPSSGAGRKPTRNSTHTKRRVWVTEVEAAARLSTATTVPLTQCHVVLLVCLSRYFSILVLILSLQVFGTEIVLNTRDLLRYRNVMLCWEGLPNRDFPVVFHPVFGKDEREENSPSFFNVAEVETIERYLKSLLDDNVRSRGLKHLKPEMIGVISPYKRQVINFGRFRQVTSSLPFTLHILPVF